MKHFLFLSFLSFFLMGCLYERRIDPPRYSDYQPEVMERTVFENSIMLVDVSSVKPEIKKAGKIYLQGDYMFLGDTNRGFYVYNNANPENPTLEAFLKIPGATDLAIRNGVVYVNQAVDLVAFSYDIEQRKVVIHKRIKNTFPVMRSPDGFYPNYKDGEVVVDWHKK